MRRRDHLIITVDYELFGNGTGCVDPCLCEPLERMARLVEQYGGRLEIFVEALEFLAMEKEPVFADALAAVKRQLLDMVQRGHRLQVHIHPQWQHAVFSDGRWTFPDATWRTGDVPEADLNQLVNDAVAWIRGIAPSGPEPWVFRAGGWCVQPLAQVEPVLRAARIRGESSFAPGLVNRDAVAWYDFRQCPSAPWWPLNSSVRAEADSAMIEIPIAVGRVNALRHLRERVRRKREGEFAPGCQGAYRGRGPSWQRLAAMLHRARAARLAMLDVCALPAEMLIAIIRGWQLRFGASDSALPIVAIAHTKNFSSVAELELESLLHWVDAQEQITLSTYAGWHAEQFEEGEAA